MASEALCAPGTVSSEQLGSCLVVGRLWFWEHMLFEHFMVVFGHGPWPGCFHCNQLRCAHRLVHKCAPAPRGCACSLSPGDLGREQEGFFMAPDNYTPCHGV